MVDWLIPLVIVLVALGAGALAVWAYRDERDRADRAEARAAQAEARAAPAELSDDDLEHEMKRLFGGPRWGSPQRKKGKT